eukprot:SAG22_NODE_104_length_20159_cov_5.877517_17_plen_230_part_00
MGGKTPAAAVRSSVLFHFPHRLRTAVRCLQCYNSKHLPNASDAILCLATSKDPTSAGAWEHRGRVFDGPGGSKSGALLIRETGPHYLIWGAGTISIAASDDLLNWSEGTRFITETAFAAAAHQNDGVEAGPPPLPLSNGHYVFFHNSWQTNTTLYDKAGYQPAWVVLNGSHPPDIIARAPEPLWSPQRAAWMTGAPPYTCNGGATLVRPFHRAAIVARVYLPSHAVPPP